MAGLSNAPASQPVEPGAVAAAMSRIPSGLFILTAQFEEARTGMLVTRVQRCSDNPPLVLVAMLKGQPIEPLIRDARGFALCQIACDDLLARRKFEATPHHGEDPFVSLPVFAAPSGAPILERAVAYLDCELVRHLDVENTTGIYIGLVRSGGVLHPAKVNGNGHTNGNGHGNGNGNRNAHPPVKAPAPRRPRS
jgi:flavin reductase (DIM6/NTAB) family NADH-FMN oxidoreductase RutF